MASDVLSPLQIFRDALQAGFSPDRAETATAVALAESSGRTDAIGDVNLTGPGEESVGLWQINYRPWRDQGNDTRDPRANLNPAHNAKAAYRISGKGSDFTPWSTFNNGAYEQYLPKAQEAAKQSKNLPWYRTITDYWGITSDPGATTILGPANSTDKSIVSSIYGPDIANVASPQNVQSIFAATSLLIGKPLIWLTAPNNMTRVILFGAGVLLIFMGIYFVGKDVAG